MFCFRRKLIFCFVLGIILFIPAFTQATWSSIASFFVDPGYDLYGRNQIEAQLLKTTNKIYFYVDKQWYEDFDRRNELGNKLYNLANDFEYKTYPNLTNLLGTEDNPGVDNDSRVIILLQPLKSDFGGYVRAIDSYESSIAEYSNEGQIVYLNIELFLESSLDVLNYQLAHEFTHLITLKQKPGSETWFYELMSEFGGQIAGSDVSLITRQRAQGLLNSTTINLVNWENNNRDYAEVYLFALYLKEQFGNQFLSEILKHPSSSGLNSFNEVLKKYQTDFEKVVLDWLVANIANDCSLGDEYCYQNSILKDYSAIAYSYYLPTHVKSSLSITNSIKAWDAKLQKITGGIGVIKLKFTIPEEVPIKKIPYIIEKVNGAKTVGFLDFSLVNIRELYVEEMGNENKAIYFIPFIGFSGEQGKTYYHSWEVSNTVLIEENEEEIIQSLLKKIDELKRQVVMLQTQLAMQKTYQYNDSCSIFSQDLSYGMRSEQVKCLQQFLSNLGNDIYPEKLVTGYYGPLTLAAVQRYQLFKGIITTGYFGPLTRAAANQNL